MPDAGGGRELSDDLKREIETAPYEPLLPVEKKLVAWSLGIGVALLVVLRIVNKLYPAVS